MWEFNKLETIVVCTWATIGVIAFMLLLFQGYALYRHQNYFIFKNKWSWITIDKIDNIVEFFYNKIFKIASYITGIVLIIHFLTHLHFTL